MALAQHAMAQQLPVCSHNGDFQPSTSHHATTTNPCLRCPVPCHEQVVLMALLHTWHAAGEADAYNRQLALAPLALLATHAHSALLAALIYIWEV